MKRKNLTIATLFLAVLTAAACKKETPPAAAPVAVPAAPAAVSVADITLGSSLNADKTVATAAATFKSTDTIYAAVKTNGTSSAATLAAKWTYQDGCTVHQESLVDHRPGRRSRSFTRQGRRLAGGHKVRSP